MRLPWSEEAGSLIPTTSGTSHAESETEGLQALLDDQRRIGTDLRTCTHCGEHARFDPAGQGGWSACSACGQLA